MPDEQAISAYERDGVVCLRQAFSPRWVNDVAEGMETAIEKGAGRDTVFNIAAPGEPGFFFYDSFMWKHIDVFRQFVFDSPAPDLARRYRGENLVHGGSMECETFRRVR